MKINVFHVKNQIGKGQQFVFAVKPADIDIEPADLAVIGDIKVEGEVVNEGAILQLNGSVNASVVSKCSRCLEEYTAVVSADFSEKFQYREQTNDESDIVFLSGEEIDITDLVRETLLLAEPMKTVCSEDCKGICPKCGVNLNTTTCSCMRHSVDPRLAVLQNLLNKE